MVYIYVSHIYVLMAPQEPFASSVSSIMVVKFPTISCSSGKVVHVYVAHTRCFFQKKKTHVLMCKGMEHLSQSKTRVSYQPSQGLLVRKWQQLLVGKPRQWHQGTLCLHRFWYFYDTGSFLLGSAKAWSYLGLLDSSPPPTVDCWFEFEVLQPL